MIMITPLDLVPEIQAASASSAYTTYNYGSTQTFDFRGKPCDSDTDTD